MDNMKNIRPTIGAMAYQVFITMVAKPLFVVRNSSEKNLPNAIIKYISLRPEEDSKRLSGSG